MLTLLKTYNKTIEIRTSARAQIVFLSQNVNALIFSLTIHSFVPFQQFMSDNQKWDYQRDMSRMCQRQISSGSSGVQHLNRMPGINPFVEALLLRASKWANCRTLLIIICVSQRLLLLGSLEGVKYWWRGLLCDDLSWSLPSTKIIRLVHCVLCLFASEPQSVCGPAVARWSRAAREVGKGRGGIRAHYVWRCQGRSADWEARPEYVYR